MEFQPGDLVQLKSGSPLMTVEQVGKDYVDRDAVWCTWSERVGNKNVIQRETFNPVVLEKAERSAGGSLRVSRA